jgi:DNA-binding NarL/FixJ family response regulator
LSGKATAASLIIAEPVELIREGLAALCSRTGRFDIVAACPDGAEAFDAVLRLQPDVCLFSLDLPKLHTLELIARLRQDGSPSRFAVLSDRADRKTVLECLRAGAGAYLLRTGSVDELLQGLGQLRKGSIYLAPEVDADSIFRHPVAASGDDPIERLTSREYQVFSLLVDGVRPKEIANRLELSPKTVDSHRKNLMHKLNIHDVAGLVKFALKRNLA